MLCSLGSETHLLIRHEKVLRTFDPIIQDTLTEHMGASFPLACASAPRAFAYAN